MDPVRALRVLGVEPGASFAGKVHYLYRKQLEEAAVLVINKCDVVEPARIAALRSALEHEFPRARIFEVSARTGQGLDEWFEAIVPAVEGHDQSADPECGDRLRPLRRRRGAAGMAQRQRPSGRRTV